MIWRESGEEGAQLLEAAFAWEMANGRHAQPTDEVEVRQWRRQMDAATAESLFADGACRPVLTGMLL
jgi:hypothetical protein